MAVIAAAAILVAALVLWLPAHFHEVAMREILDQANRNTAAAQAAASSAAESAARAKASAQDAWNKTTGGS